ncbi:kinase-like protein, partial [Coniochaeta sp. PMI_546]
HTLTLEYMSNGTLKNYLESNKDVCLEQRKQWVVEAARCVQLLHHSAVIHCDIGPHNFVLDDHLCLKVIDFSGSSIDGSRTETCPGVRYTAPNLSRPSKQAPTVKTDLFSLGSTIYYIMTGKAPFQEFQSEEVGRRYSSHDFPDLNGIPFAEIIQSCWLQKFEVVDELVSLLKV